MLGGVVRLANCCAEVSSQAVKKTFEEPSGSNGRLLSLAANIERGSAEGRRARNVSACAATVARVSVLPYFRDFDVTARRGGGE